MDPMQRDDDWKLWAWQRFQQLVGACLIVLPAGYLLFCLANGDLPADFRSDISIKENDHTALDHRNIAQAIGSCHLPGAVGSWPAEWLQTLGISDDRALRTDAATLKTPNNTAIQDTELTSFERAALWQSARIGKERERFLDEAEKRQDRSRRNQLRALCLSAAAAFMVGLRTLALNKDIEAPFRSLMKGALLPISVLTLLMPVLATAVSGIATFDGDPNIVVRNVRTLGQLEQLHGRIAEDVTGDPFLCPIMQATKALYQVNLATPPDNRSASIASKKLECLMDRSKRTVAWEQRHEQILNDATPSLAHAGDLPRPSDTSPVSSVKPQVGPDNVKSPPLMVTGKFDTDRNPGDVCQQAFQEPIIAQDNATPADTTQTALKKETVPAKRQGKT
jgi:hypothetical protein